MKLTKAIELLQAELAYGEGSHEADLENAIKLGIKAIEWRLREEKRQPYLAYSPLPGETKE